jgi:hypothetical protein
MRNEKKIIKVKRILFCDNEVVQLFVVESTCRYRRPDGLKVETFNRSITTNAKV